MERAILVTCAVFLFLSLFIEDTIALESDFKPTAQGPMWFGPRMGRRKRNPLDDDGFKTPTAFEREQLEALLDVIQESPWAILTEGKRHTTSFTPRLGRDSGEEYLANDKWFQDQDFGLFQRSPPFAPRLGRRFSPYSPRLGRKTEKLGYS